MTFTIFDRDALADLKSRPEGGVYRTGFNTSGDTRGLHVNPAHLDHQMTMDQNLQKWKQISTPNYADEIPPLTKVA